MKTTPHPIHKNIPSDQTTEVLTRHLTGDFRVSPMAEHPSSVDMAQEAASKLGVFLPPELVAHLTGPFPGIHVEVVKEAWPRPKAWSVGPFWSFLYAIHTYTVSPDSSDWMRLEAVGRKFQDETGLAAVPVLQVVGDANVYCVTPGGEFVRFDHELRSLTPVSGTFFQIFEYEVAALAERAIRMKNAS
jgi:hypothetical protein